MSDLAVLKHLLPGTASVRGRRFPAWLPIMLTQSVVMISFFLWIESGLGIICNHNDENHGKWVLEARKKPHQGVTTHTQVINAVTRQQSWFCIIIIKEAFVVFLQRDWGIAILLVRHMHQCIYHKKTQKDLLKAHWNWKYSPDFNGI